MTETKVVFVQIVDRPARKLILKRGKNAADYFSYVEEIGCGKGDDSAAWDILKEIKEAIEEPVGVWLPENLQKEGTGSYAHGVEVPADYTGAIPEGFDVIDLAPCRLMLFQGEPYEEENFGEAVSEGMEFIGRFNPESYGYEFAPELAPRMQLKPLGWRGYIEMRPVRELEA